MLLLSFKEDVSVSGDSQDNLILHSPTLNFNLGKLSQGLRDAIAFLNNNNVTETELSNIVLESDGNSTLPQFYYYLERFISLGLISHSVKAEETVVATLVPICVPYQLSLTGIKLDRKYILSRFAYCHREGSQTIWQSPLSQAKLILTDWRGGAILTELSQPQDCVSLTKISGVSVELAQSLLNLFWSAKLLSTVDDEGKVLDEVAIEKAICHTEQSPESSEGSVATGLSSFGDELQRQPLKYLEDSSCRQNDGGGRGGFLHLSNHRVDISQRNLVLEEDKNEILAQWEFHDLLFHSLSRKGRQTNPVGKSFRFVGKIKPLPPIKPKVNTEVIELYKPDIEQLQQEDVPFTLVLEQRKSIRNYSNDPISAHQLGEFLYRTARVRKIVPREYLDCSDRPYPCGGASYELEIYLVINTCEDINSGIYHYCPQNHQLEFICPQNQYVQSLLKDAQHANGEDSLPQVLIIFTARFARVSWAYESIAYSLILKHVGVLYQTMYLVATAMKLAPCALGSGNPDLFATATGIDYYTESSVGEFMLGRF